MVYGNWRHSDKKVLRFFSLLLCKLGKHIPVYIKLGGVTRTDRPLNCAICGDKDFWK